MPPNDGQIPYYVSIGDHHVMGKVRYVRKLIDNKVMCDACYSTEHVMRDTECPGVRDWSDYVRQFEEERDMFGPCLSPRPGDGARPVRAAVMTSAWKAGK